MGNILSGSVVVIAIPNAHTKDDATDKNYVLLKMQTPFSAIMAFMRSWMLLAVFSGSYTNVIMHTIKRPLSAHGNYRLIIDNNNITYVT